MRSVCSQLQLKLSGCTLAIFPHDGGGQEAGAVGPRCSVCMIVNKVILNPFQSNSYALLLIHAAFRYCSSTFDVASAKKCVWQD
jgi:hypothetical protein